MALIANTSGQPRGTSGFAMRIDDVFFISVGGGFHVLTGRVEAGTVRVGDRITVDGRVFAVAGIESLRQQITTASAGDQIGLAVRGAEPAAFKQGDFVTS